MFRSWLSEAIQKSDMSLRPAYYSGRGPTLTDLSEKHLEAIWQATKENQGDEAADAFATMVTHVKNLSATRFLLTLQALDENDFTLDEGVLNAGQDAHADDPFTALFSVLSASTRDRNGYGDETERQAFLYRIGKAKTDKDTSPKDLTHPQGYPR